MYSPKLTRRSLLVAAGILPAMASDTRGPLIEWAPYSPQTPESIPTTSGYQSSYGVLVRVWDDRADVEAFRVTLQYLVGGDLRVASKLVDRVRDGVGSSDGWSAMCFDLGRPVVVQRITAMSLVSGGSNSVN